MVESERNIQKREKWKTAFLHDWRPGRELINRLYTFFLYLTRETRERSCIGDEAGGPQWSQRGTGMTMTMMVIWALR